MDASQRAILEQASEIIKNANTKSWESGMVALAFIMMGLLGIFMFRWFLNSKSKSDAEALLREQNLSNKIDQVENFTRETLVKLQEKSIDAMNNIANAMRGCLERQNINKL